MSKDKKVAFTWIITILKKLNISFFITGGLVAIALNRLVNYKEIANEFFSKN